MKPREVNILQTKPRGVSILLQTKPRGVSILQTKPRGVSILQTLRPKSKSVFSIDNILYYMYIWSAYLDIPGDIVLPSEVANKLTVSCGGGTEVGTDAVPAGLSVIVHKESRGQVTCLGTLGLEQGQIIGAWEDVQKKAKCNYANDIINDIIACYPWPPPLRCSVLMAEAERLSLKRQRELMSPRMLVLCPHSL